MSQEDVGDLEGLQAFTKRYDPEDFDYAHILQYGDQEPLLLESPLKARVMITAETIEQIPCGSTNREVYASKDFGDMYITDEDTSIWDPSSTHTSVVIDTMEHTGYRMICCDIQQYVVVCSSIQCYAKGYNGTQWEIVEIMRKSYSHLMGHGWSRGGRSSLFWKYMESGGHTSSNNSVCDYGESMVDQLCEVTCLWRHAVVWE
jgi:hypothetical protein